MRKQALGIALMAALLNGPAAARQAPADLPPVIAELLELLVEDEETGGAEAWLERIQRLLDHPVDLNRASAAELEEIPFIDAMMAAEVVSFRERFGDFDDAAELQAVRGFDAELVRLIGPLFMAGAAAVPPDEMHPARTRPRTPFSAEAVTRTGRRFELGRGYDGDTTRTTYLGSPYRVYSRFRLARGRHFQANLTMEKDPGEPFGWNPTDRIYGFDHVSGHVAVRNTGIIRTAVAGDYAIELGQGLLFWRSAAFSKGAHPTRVPIRGGRGFVPYGSTDSGLFFRGAAAGVQLTSALDFGAFAARTNRDATINETDSTTFVTTISYTGLHRTPSELRRKHALRESAAGGYARYATRKVQISAAGYAVNYDYAFANGGAFYRHFYFEGRTHRAASTDLRLRLGDVLLFGEAAVTDRARAAVGGVHVGGDSGVEALLIVRDYPAAFHSPFGNPFSERSGAAQNERGFYSALSYRVSPRLSAAVFADQFQFPWLRFGVYRPGGGMDLYGRIEWRPRRGTLAYVQLRHHAREEAAAITDQSGRETRGLALRTRRSARLHGEIPVNGRITLRGRVEGVHVTRGEASERGILVYQDIRIRPIDRLVVDARTGFFSTGSFDSRIHTYEYDLMGMFTVPAVFGDGQRSYVLVRYDMSNRFSLWLRYTETRWENIRSFGSGLDETPGNRLREARAQIRLRI